MALNRLPPPNVAGTIPSFYSTDLGTSLEVPFSMNSMVNKTAVGGFQLRFKTTTTDIVLLNIESDNYTLESDETSVIFNLQDIRDQLVVGNFYKVQIAYVDKSNNIVGYYSTVAIVKYTNKPQISIVGLNQQSLTSISNARFIGTYKNSDNSEKVYQYKFILYNNLGEELETSGWLLHNIQNDDSITESNDIYSFKYNLLEGLSYYVQYFVSTNNGLSTQTVKYKITMGLYTSSGLNIAMNANLDYENGRVKISIMPATPEYDKTTKQELPIVLSGTYIISRTSSKDKFMLNETVQNNKMNVEITTADPYSFYDYAVEAGVEYRYFIQKYNSQNVFSQKVASNFVAVFFEDIFLYDGNKQLKVRFNPQVSSFKTVVADSKKTTLGRQYPFIFRNGILNYKEFPISGLISYLTDNEELFMSKEDWYTLIEGNFGGVEQEVFMSSTDITDANLKYEKMFKLYVLDWLNDGSIKLFKSPQEGNYIVRLTNVSLSPNNTVSRMLHTFSCTASEVAEYSLSNLANYSLTNSINENITQETVKIINIRDIYRQYLLADQTPDKSEYLNKLKEYDFTEGQACRKIRFLHQLTEYDLDQRKSTYGMIFSWGDYNFAIDRSGFAEIEMDSYITSPLLLLNPASGSKDTGYIELTILNSDNDSLASVENTVSLPIFGYSIYGINEPMETVKNDKGAIIGSYSRNLLAEFNGYKSNLSNINVIKYNLIPLYRIGIGQNVEAEWEKIKTDLDLDVDPKFLLVNCCYLYRERNGKMEYWKYDGKQITSVSNYGTKILFGDVEQDITALTDKATVNFISSIPTKSDGTVELRVQNGVQVQIYGTQQIVSYLSEQYDLHEISNKELDAYKNYCMKLYNFKEISPSTLTTLSAAMKKCLYIFQDRTFVKIDSSEIELYANLITIYGPQWPTVYTDKDIQDSWELYLTAKATLDDQLSSYLES